MTATSEHCTSHSGCVEESRVELDSGVVVGELVSEGELVAGEMSAGESKYAGLGEQQAESHAGKTNAGEVDAEDQVAAMEAVNSAETGTSKLVVGREKILYREWVQVQADEGPSKFVYIQNRVTLFAIQLHTALILPMLHFSTGESG